LPPLSPRHAGSRDQASAPQSPHRSRESEFRRRPWPLSGPRPVDSNETRRIWAAVNPAGDCIRDDTSSSNDQKPAWPFGFGARSSIADGLVVRCAGSADRRRSAASRWYQSAGSWPRMLGKVFVNHAEIHRPAGSSPEKHFVYISQYICPFLVPTPGAPRPSKRSPFPSYPLRPSILRMLLASRERGCGLLLRSSLLEGIANRIDGLAPATDHGCSTIEPRSRPTPPGLFSGDSAHVLVCGVEMRNRLRNSLRFCFRSKSPRTDSRSN